MCFHKIYIIKDFHFEGNKIYHCRITFDYYIIVSNLLIVFVFKFKFLYEYCIYLFNTLALLLNNRIHSIILPKRSLSTLSLSALFHILSLYEYAFIYIEVDIRRLNNVKTCF